MPNSIRNAFSGFGTEILEQLRENTQVSLDDAAFEERCIGIEKATSAMFEAGVSEEVTIQLLQKYWDLKLSEAKMFVEHRKDQ